MPDPLPVLRSQILENGHFAHAFSTREAHAGGARVADLPRGDIDFALVGDASELRENQRRLAAAVGFDPGRLYQAKQVHGSTVLVARGEPASMLEQECDALVGEPGSGASVAVRVADCVPVLLADPKTGRVAAVHAGWRGVAAGVVGAAVRSLALAGFSIAREEPGARAFSSLAAAAGEFLAAIGPSIGPCCFEVGADVGVILASTADESVIARRDASRAKVFVDLRKAVRLQLRALGLRDAAIDDVPNESNATCTRCDTMRFHSYRRDGERSGRMIAVIAPR